MPAPDDLALLADAAQEAGRIAMRHFGQQPETWEKPGDQGPVTEADLAIDAMLKSELRAARPAYGWLSEESEDDALRLEADRIFIVDPIDGTRAFIAGREHFSNVIAIAEGGRVTAACVHLPALNETFLAEIGRGATRNGRIVTASDGSIASGATVLGAKSNLQADHWAADPPPLTPTFRSSLAYRLALVAGGDFDAAFSFRDTWEWDIAAGTLLVTEAGGAITDAAGQELRFNNPKPQVAGMIAAGPALHRELLAARLGTG